MINHTIKKSYVIIDTPESCVYCSLASSDGYDISMRCPLLNTSFSTNTNLDWKNEECPLKSIELNIKLDV